MGLNSRCEMRNVWRVQRAIRVWQNQSKGALLHSPAKEAIDRPLHRVASMIPEALVTIALTSATLTLA